MNNSLQARQSSTLTRRAPLRVALALIAGLICLVINQGPLDVYSQSQGRTVTLTRVSVLRATGGAVVSIAADAPLHRAQTRQDGSNYRVSIANARLSDSVKSSPGVTITTSGEAVEILVRVEQGAKVTSWANANRLNLSIDGQLITSEDATQTQALLDPKLRVDASPGANSLSESKSGGASKEAKPASSAALTQNADTSFISSLFSTTSLFIVLGLGALGLLALYGLRSRRTIRQDEPPSIVSGSQSETPEFGNAQIQSEVTPVTPAPASAANIVDQPIPAPSTVRPANSTASALYGAYRVDQEVGKLVLGQPHRLDVLASRSPDDRGAIETSLLKTIGAADAGDEARKRARQALEEYGFVARQCASLLLASEAFERMAAARTLGEIKSPIALPFLLEALYDGETSVRNQAISSIGELKLPSAIGALLDLARRHPEVPSALLSRSLSACSLEGLDFFNEQPTVKVPAVGDGAQNAVQTADSVRSAIEIEELPETLQNEGLVRALAAVKDSNDSTRAQAIQDLARFRAQIAVHALVTIVRTDVNSGFRAMAISSLGKINHHSVFPAVLIGMADEAREVRAAAARALNRLTFDRGDAYVHVLETADEDVIRDVARACIQAGIVSQGIDRLASTDHRQAYEAFSMVSLLSRADMTDPVFDAILKHPSLEVRLSAAKLLATKGKPKVIDRLRLIALEDGISEEVRTAVVDILYKNGEDVATEQKDLDKELESSTFSVKESEIGKDES